MITRSITFWDEVNDQLVEEAEKRHVSINWVVNQLCKEALTRLSEDFRLTR